MPNRIIPVFVGHRFNKSYIDDFREAINEALKITNASIHIIKEMPLKPLYADITYETGHILKDKIQPMIDKSLFCIFDITEQNQPNVFIKVGYAYGKGKHVLLTGKTLPPSNLAGYDTIIYSSFKELSEKLATHLPPIVMKSIISKAKPEDTIPMPIVELIYGNWKSGKVTKKTEIYKLLPQSEADPMIQSFIKSGEFEVRNDSVILTSRGIRIFGGFISKELRKIEHDIIRVIKKMRGMGEEPTPRRIAKELDISEDIVFAHLKDMHNDFLVTYRTSGKEPNLDTEYILCEKAFEPPFD